MGEFGNEDAEMAHALIQEAYQRQWTLIVIRSGKKMVLPEENVVVNGSSVTQANATPTTQPAQAGNEEKVIPKELSPLKGIIR
jgi:hypothetical protein